jgi:hypothetical protein
VALRITVELARRCPPEQLPTALSSAGEAPFFPLCSSLSPPSSHRTPSPFPSYSLLSCPYLSPPVNPTSPPITSGEVHLRLPRQPQAHALRPRRRRPRRPGGRRRAGPSDPAGPGQRAGAARRGTSVGRWACLSSQPLFRPRSCCFRTAISFVHVLSHFHTSSRSFVRLFCSPHVTPTFLW